MATHFVWALNLGRIVIWERKNKEGWFRKSYCKGNRGFECFFHRLTSCPYPNDKLLAANSTSVEDTEAVVFYPKSGGPAIPDIFLPLMKCLSIKKDFYYIW